MPCYQQRNVEQMLDINTDRELIAAGLREMGFTATLNSSGVITFSGTNSVSGIYDYGSISGTVLTSNYGLYITVLKKFIGVANLKQNAASHNWKLTPKGDDPFTFDLKKGNDTIGVEIKDGGLIKLTSADAISAPNHVNASSLVNAVTKMAGGKPTIVNLKHNTAKVSLQQKRKLSN